MKTLLLLGVSLSLLLPRLAALTITHSSQVSSQREFRVSGDVTAFHDFFVPSFNPSLGTLDSVTLSTSLTVEGRSSNENTHSQPDRINPSFTLQSAVTTSFFMAFSPVSTFTSPSVSVPAWGFTSLEGSAFHTISETFSDPAILETLQGNGTERITTSAKISTHPPRPYPTISFVGITTVTFNYTPAQPAASPQFQIASLSVPDGGNTLGIFAAAACAVFLFHRRRVLAAK